MHQKTFTWMAAAILCAVLTPSAKAQKMAPGDWPMYRHDVEGSGFSPLKQIDTSNVDKLSQAWTMPLSERGGLEVTPIVVNGVMYLPGSGHVFALDAATGKEIWHYDVARPSTSGVAFCPATMQPAAHRLDRRAQSSSRSTPPPASPSEFRHERRVDIAVGYSGVPTVFKNLAILGATRRRSAGRAARRHARVRRARRQEAVGVSTPCRGPASRVTTRG